MISTKHLVQSCRDVPDTWIFEHFCKLGEKLTGQDVKFKSLFKPDERTPSMCIFYNGEKKKYLFKDFSTGKGGTAFRLVQELYNEDVSGTCARILSTYNDHVLLNNGVEHKITDFKVRSKYKVTEHVERNWYKSDVEYWTKYGLNSKILDHYKIKPLEYYKMTKTSEDGEISSLEIRGKYLYGYFQKNGSLYKIYQPTNKQYKFIKVKDYRQGSEQLTGKDNLVICSSLKDAMVVRMMIDNVDVVIPDSENTLIKESEMSEYRKKYKSIFTLFDNDEAGISAMRKYKDAYGIDYLYLNSEKDISDAVAKHGFEQIRFKFLIMINKKLNVQNESVDL